MKMSLYNNSKRNLDIAKKREFKCQLCGKQPPETYYAFRYSGRVCFDCLSTFFTMSTILFIILLIVGLIATLETVSNYISG